MVLNLYQRSEHFSTWYGLKNKDSIDKIYLQYQVGRS